MKILLNAYNLKVGGGLNVAFNFIEQLKNYTEDNFYVFVPGNCGYEKYASSHIQIIEVPERFQNYLFRPYLDHIWLPKHIKSIKPDVVFSMGNFALPVKIKQGLLFHYPYMIYDMHDGIRITAFEKAIIRLQSVIFKARLKYATKIFPQTIVAGERLKKLYGEKLVVRPIPNAYTKLPAQPNGQGDSKYNFNAPFHYLLCLSKYYPHKNVEVLLDVAALLKENNSSIKLVTTIGPDKLEGAQLFLDEIEKRALGDYLINIGPVSVYEVPALYRQTDGLILPTYMESFTATYVDAMYFRKPIFTSDMDFAYEVCGEAAYYFDPSKASDIYRVIREAFDNPSQMQQKIEKGVQRSLQFPDWKKVAEMYVSELKSL